MEKRTEEGGEGRVQRYADLMLDWTFKRVFGERGDRVLLISLLQELLGFPIAYIEYLPNEVTPETDENRTFVLDLRCRCIDGRRIIVEVQTYHQDCFFSRCVAYAAGEYSSQTQSGQAYSIVEPVYLVAIMSGSASLEHSGPGSESGGKVIFRYAMAETETGEVLADTISATFVELGRFDRSEGECRTMLDRWLYVLKHMKRMDSLPAAFRCGVFERLFQAVEITKFNREEMDAYDRAVFAEMDRQNILQTARNEGIAYGREAGIAVGREIGIAEGLRQGHATGVVEGRKAGVAEGLQKGIDMEKKSIAGTMKAMGIDSEIISRSTGLTIEQVRDL